MSLRLICPDTDTLKSAMEPFSRKAKFLNASTMAIDMGVPIVANIIMLAGLVAVNERLLDISDAEEKIKRSSPDPNVDTDLKALRDGYQEIETCSQLEPSLIWPLVV